MYKIKDIANITGIQPQTLRVWEKRYGILIPERTNAKIRYYSEKDLLKLLNISLLQENGWRISKIAKLSELDMQREIANLNVSQYQDNVIIQLLIKALCTMDAALFLNVSNSCIQKEGLKFTFINYFIPFFDRIGILWQANTINPAQEHMISNLIRQKIIAEIDKLSLNVEPPIDFILFCRENEYHEISLLFYDFVLKSKGYNVTYLGQNVPTLDVIRVVQLVEPKVGLVTSVLNKMDADRVGSIFKEIHDATNCPIYIGGGSFSTATIEHTPYLHAIDKLIGY
jgi:DNA-binding transcriptional MerR regulator